MNMLIAWQMNPLMLKKQCQFPLLLFCVVMKLLYKLCALLITLSLHAKRWPYGYVVYKKEKNSVPLYILSPKGFVIVSSDGTKKRTIDTSLIGMTTIGGTLCLNDNTLMQDTMWFDGPEHIAIPGID